MAPKEHLREIVAQFAGLTAEAIDADFSLKSGGLQSSVRRAALAAAVRRHLGVNIVDVYTVVTFRELEMAVFGGGSQTAPSSTTTTRLAKACCCFRFEQDR